MCTTCGCSNDARARLTDPASGKVSDIGSHVPHRHAHRHAHDHDHDPAHEHEIGGHRHSHETHEHAHTGHAETHARAHGTVVKLEQQVLARNNRLAERNRGWLASRNILALNLVSSPGAGKTTLLERTIRDVADDIPLTVVEGDQETMFDAERIRATGCRSIQVNTGTGCHLEAEMLAGALKALDPAPDSVVMIENVGNLVCPALFDLGEHDKVVVLSVTEGDDKPLKYPHMFRAAHLMIINKIDLLPHVDFDIARCIEYARRINPDIQVLETSAKTGEGLDDWYAWLRRRLEAVS